MAFKESILPTTTLKLVAGRPRIRLELEVETSTTMPMSLLTQSISLTQRGSG